MAKPSEFEFVIHTFPWRNQDQIARHHLVIRVRCDSEEQRDTWIGEIQARVSQQQQNVKGAALPCPDSSRWSSYGEPANRKLLILVNPFSGRKMGHTIWKETEKIFRLAGIELSVRCRSPSSLPIEF